MGFTEPFLHDIRNFDFDEFVEFVFNHRVVPFPAGSETDTSKMPWFWCAEVLFDPGEVAQHYVRLFNEPGFLLTRFSRPQLQQGCWAMWSENLDCSVYNIVFQNKMLFYKGEVVEEEQLPFSTRSECIRSMYWLFERLFAADPLEDACFMWWDGFCYDWHCGTRSRSEDKLLQDALFETLSRILTIDSPHCQQSALHGLGHLHHPDTENIVAEYLAGHPELPTAAIEYAKAAASFQIM